MIQYEFGTYGIAFIFQLRGSIFPKALVWSLPSAFLSLAAIMFFKRFPGALPAGFQASPAIQLWSSFTGMLGFLLVFRTQIAYSRFWEGGTLLQQVRGVWFNATSNLIAFSNSSSAAQCDLAKFQQLLVKLMSLLYCTALQQVASVDDTHFEVLDLTGIDEASLLFLSSASDRTEVVMQWIQRLIVQNINNAVIPIAPPITSRVFQELSNGIVDMQNVKKIREFPFPFPYAQVITAFLLLLITINPILIALIIESMWVAFTLSLIVPFAFWSLNFIAAELESPFGDDENDLPVAILQEGFNESLCLLLHPVVATPPHYEVASKTNIHAKQKCKLTVMTKSFESIDSNYTERSELDGLLLTSSGGGAKDVELPSSSPCESDIFAEADVHESGPQDLVAMPTGITHLDLPPGQVPETRCTPMPVTVISSSEQLPKQSPLICNTGIKHMHVSDSVPSSVTFVVPETSSISLHGQVQQASSTSCKHKVDQFPSSATISRTAPGTAAGTAEIDAHVTPSIDADFPKLKGDAEMKLSDSESVRLASNMPHDEYYDLEGQRSRSPITL